MKKHNRLLTAILILMIVLSSVLYTGCSGGAEPAQQAATADEAPAEKKTEAPEDKILSVTLTDDEPMRFAKDQTKEVEFTVNSDKRITEDDLIPEVDDPEIVEAQQIKIKAADL